jgi:multidrug efflux pump
LRHPKLTLGLTLVTIGVNAALFVIVPKGFFPQQDTGRMGGAILASQDISFQAMRQKVEQAAGVIKSDPAVENVTAFTGSFGGTSNTARMFISLKPLEDRMTSADQVIARLRGRLADIAGVRVSLTPVQDLQIGGRLGNAQYQFTLQADSVTTLNEWAPKMTRKLQSLPQIVDLRRWCRSTGTPHRVWA